NAGLTWVESSAPYQNWQGITCSAGGSRLVAVADDWGKPGITHSGSVWLSEDSGDTWKIATARLGRWTCVASSADACQASTVFPAGPLDKTSGRFVVHARPTPPTEAEIPADGDLKGFPQPLGQLCVCQNRDPVWEM